jgi:hypothetical protein
MKLGRFERNICSLLPFNQSISLLNYFHGFTFAVKDLVVVLANINHLSDSFTGVYQSSLSAKHHGRMPS